jgi:serine/threonine-protein kinase
MLSGRPPFSGDTALALAMQHIQAEPVGLDQLRPDLPDQLVQIVHRLLKKNPEDRFGSAMELAREIRSFIDNHMQGQGDKMVPFSGLVIEHQAISSSSVTEELQILMKGRKTGASSNSSPSDTSAPRWIRNALLWGGLPFVLSSAIGFWFANADPFSNQSISTAGVVRESSIQRQYALALVENTPKHWNAVSEFFPPVDAVSRNYYLKSELQIARLRFEGEDFIAAESNLRTIIDSPYADEVLRTVGRIELGWLQQRGRRQTIGEEINNENYARAMRELSTLVPEKQRLIRDALPPKVRAEWDSVDSMYQSQPKASTGAVQASADDKPQVGASGREN